MKEEDANTAILSGDTNLIRLDGSIRCLKSGLPNLGCHQGMVMLRDVIEQMKGFDEQYHIIADYDLIVRIINAGYKMKLVHVVVANFVIGGTSQALKNVPVYFKERYEIYPNKASFDGKGADNVLKQIGRYVSSGYGFRRDNFRACRGRNRRTNA